MKRDAKERESCAAQLRKEKKRIDTLCVYVKGVVVVDVVVVVVDLLIVQPGQEAIEAGAKLALEGKLATRHYPNGILYDYRGDSDSKEDDPEAQHNTGLTRIMHEYTEYQLCFDDMVALFGGVCAPLRVY